MFAELQKELHFKFLSQLAFESPQEREEIQARGLKKLRENRVAQEAQELGSRFAEKIESSYIPLVSVRFIHENVGYGLFLEETVEEGCYVGEYTGVVRKNDRRYFAPLNNYCYEYPVADDIGRSYVIDATEGHLTRFINHSYTPNLHAKYAFANGFYHLIFLAGRNLKAGEQLTFDYGKNYWFIRSKPEIL